MVISYGCKILMTLIFVDLVMLQDDYQYSTFTDFITAFYTFLEFMLRLVRPVSAFPYFMNFEFYRNLGRFGIFAFLYLSLASTFGGTNSAPFSLN